MAKYDLNHYFSDIDKNGLKKTWHSILSKSLKNKFDSELFVLDNFGELYEIGLAHENKINKKEMGKYYTPKDVSFLMSEWLLSLEGENICDVGCGTGNLIISYLELVGLEKAMELIQEGHIYLYDIDDVALEICKYSIALKYGSDCLKKVHCILCDFLDQNIRLPKNSKVISNPPYYKITNIGNNWKVTDVVMDSNELYSSFMEKIISSSLSSVIITPYSFIGSDKFYSLRCFLNHYNGFIYSFDNVPGQIFNGRKHGVFNSNKGNSVRASITVVENRKDCFGFRISPLIRFKSEERERLLSGNFLNQFISSKYQIVDSNHKAYYKCFPELNDLFDRWMMVSDQVLGDVLDSSVGRALYIPTTCRYFTVGASSKLKRDGKRTVYISDDIYNYIYCFFNSSFAYWYWRLYDGGINYSFSLIQNIPIFYHQLNSSQINKINQIAEEMQKREKEFFVYKKNAGKSQENIKFPVEYRNQINSVFLEALGFSSNTSIFQRIHSSSLFGGCDDE